LDIHLPGTLVAGLAFLTLVGFATALLTTAEQIAVTEAAEEASDLELPLEERRAA
jgi:hypothetical protein